MTNICSWGTCFTIVPVLVCATKIMTLWHLSHHSIICKNNTMEKEFLVQMRRSSKCGSIKIYEIFNLNLGSCADPWLTVSCILLDKSDLLILSAKLISQKKAKNPEIKFNSQQIVYYCLSLNTKNQGQRELELGPSPMSDSDMSNMLKKARNTFEENKSYPQPLSDMNASTKRGRLETQC